MNFMTREEEIMQEANTLYSVSHPFIDIAKESFIEGAKWADKTMLEKICEWLRDNIDMYAEVVLKSNAFYPEIVMCDTFEENFKKAMEE